MPKALKILLTILLGLVAAFCTIAIIGAFSLDPGESIIVGRLIGVIAALIVSVGLIVAMWRGRRAGAAA